MLFVELRFFVFAAIVLALYWSLRSDRLRKLVLLVASYIFYAAWDVRFLALILFCTLLNYTVGLVVARKRDEGGAPLVFWTGIVCNLGVLFFFKYFGFFAHSLEDLAALFGGRLSGPTLNIVLPVGVSFYTFHSMSYIIDVRRRHVEPEPSLLNFTIYVAFFPLLVAGPIIRASDFLPQLRRVRAWADVAVRPALTLFLLGFVKKACISDNIAPFVDQVFDDPGAYAAEAVVEAVFLYAVQIYCDFSGYTDMAIATARLFGYHLPLNFDAPYLSASISEFWRRWHMSLSFWLRDYLYIPLGGNRHGPFKRDRNLLITMVLGGLWHGASYNFLIWGAMHGGALIVNRQWARAFAFLKGRIPLAPLWGGLATFYWVSLAWIFFRAPSLAEAWPMAKTYLTWSSAGTMDMALPAWPLLAVFALVHWLGHRYKALDAISTAPLGVYAPAYGAAAALAIAFLPNGYRPFVYFQF